MRNSAITYEPQARAFVAPAFVIVALSLYTPVIYTVYLSLTRYDGLGSPVFIGLHNYIATLTDPQFGSSVLNTAIWVVGSLIIPVGGGLVLALMAFGLPAAGALRIPFLIPYALSGVSIGVFFDLFLGDGGALSQALSGLGLPGSQVHWLEVWPLNTIVMVLAAAWQGIGANALLFTVGLQSIPREPLEAGRVDGANGWRSFRFIVWPMLRPATTIVVGLSIVGSLKTFDIVQVMTQGGPNRVSETLGVTMYKDAFVNSDYGLGSAVAILLTIVTIAASMLYLRRQLSVDDDPAPRARAA